MIKWDGMKKQGEKKEEKRMRMWRGGNLVRCLLVHHKFKVHHADHLVGILNDVSCPGLASHHQQNARVGVVKAHKHQWRPVTLLVAEGEVLEVKPMWRIVKDVSHVFPICCSLWIKTKHSVSADKQPLGYRHASRNNSTWASFAYSYTQQHGKTASLLSEN